MLENFLYGLAILVSLGVAAQVLIFAWTWFF